MIILLLKVVVGAGVFLSALIAVTLAYSYRERMIRGSRVRRLTSPGVSLIDGDFRETAKTAEGIGTQQAVLRGYAQMRRALASRPSVRERSGLTERENIQVAKTSPTLKPISDKLERIYRTYERARFGSYSIGNEEFQSFLIDLQEVSRKIR
jgi:hypothetical protein